MKKRLTKLTMLTVVIAIFAQLGSFAASDAKITAAYGTPVIDGDIDEIWASAEQQSVELVDQEVIPSDTATRGVFRTMWDENYFYALIEVDKHGAEIWYGGGNAENSDDCADLCLTLDGNFDAMLPNGDDYAGVFRVVEGNEKSGFGWVFEELADDSLGAFKRTSSSTYQVEYAIPWSDIVPAEGNIISLEIQINDAQDGSRAGLVTWASAPCLGWRESYEHGTVTLGAKPVEQPVETPIEEPADTTPEAPVTTPSAQTSDAGIIAALAVLAAASGLVLAGKKRG